MMAMTALVMSLSPLPERNPRNENTADFKARLKSLRSWMSSPMNAPTKGPRRIVTMLPRKTPANTPIVEPMEPAFEPPAFCVNILGTKLFRISTATVITPIIMIGTQVMCERSVKCARSSAAQARGVPGIPGIMHPMSAMIRRTAAIDMSMMSCIHIIIEDFFSKSKFSA